MMGKRNVYAYLARQRKAGPHSGSRRPFPSKDAMVDYCPICLEKPLTGLGVWNRIIGEVCSLDCMEKYWEEGGSK